VLKRETCTDGSKVTFVLDLTDPVSVVGDFNDWNPQAHPLLKRSNGRRSVSLVLPPGRHAFRYLAAGGAFFDDPEADVIEPNGYGQTHAVVVVDGAATARRQQGAKLGV
jgi:hypothetical protein